MTMFSDKRLEAFFNGVVNAFHQEYVSFHWPSDKCFDGSCARPAVKPIGLGVQNGYCNWRSINILARHFFNDAPEVSAIWESDSMRAGFDPDLLHDIMLGVFIGGDGEGKWSPAYAFSDSEDAGIYTKGPAIKVMNVPAFHNTLKKP